MFQKPSVDQSPRAVVTSFCGVGLFSHERRLGEVKRQGIAIDERLVARRAPNGLYAVRHEIYDNNADSPGISRGFSIFRRIGDFFNDYADYILTFEETLEKLRDFEEEHCKKESLISSNNPRPLNHISNYTN